MNILLEPVYWVSIIMVGTCLPSDEDIDWSEYLRFDVKSKMIDHKITPTAVPVAPRTICHLQFQWGEPEPGQVIQKTFNDVAPPNITWESTNNSIYLIMAFCVTNWFDIRDAPEQGCNYTLQEWTEWVIYNIPEQNVSQGISLYDYEPSPPSKDRNVNHLIIYLVYQQNKTIHIPAPTEISWSEYEDRRTAAGFAKRYKLGNPVAGNFYYVNYDKVIMYDESASQEENKQ